MRVASNLLGMAIDTRQTTRDLPEISRERSKSRRAKELNLYVFGYKSHVGRNWGSGRRDALAAMMIAAPVAIPLLEGDGLQLPRGVEWIFYPIFMGIGALVLYFRYNAYAKEVLKDPRTHRPWIDRVERVDGLFFQGMCDCGWRGRFEKRERTAELEAHRHVARRHWPRWMGRFAGT